VEQGGPRAEELCERLYSKTGKAITAGITGSPGSGKSTLTRALARVARARGMSVGIVAIDPSSPFSGGSILGDRIRMNDVAEDSGIFIRSIATRGALGGLSRPVANAVDLMDAAGKDLVIVETVGTGQDEVDIMDVVQTVLVVSVPGMGDEIQTLKAGILEIADIHVVNKADRDGANQTIAELLSMVASGTVKSGAWIPQVIGAIATREEGSERLLDAILEHHKYLSDSGERWNREAGIARARVLKMARDMVGEELDRPAPEIERLLERVVNRSAPPHVCARAVVAAAGRKMQLEEKVDRNG
jgi:LAO/AO transport system kinase